MKKILCLIIICLTFFMNITSISANLSTNVTQVYVGTSFTTTVSLSNIAAWNVHVSASGPVSGCSISDANVTDNALNTSKNFTTTCTATGVGIITISLSGDTTDENDKISYLSDEKRVEVINKPSTPTPTEPTIPSNGGTTNQNLSSNNDLNSLSIDGCKLSPSFSSNTTSYNCSETDADSIIVNAVKSNSYAKLSGTGVRKLNFGTNNIQVIVTAQNGNKKTYSIKVNRKDNRNSDNTLASLRIEGQQIEFDKNKTEYSLVVSSKIESINISATPSDEKATVTGVGNIQLNNGENKIEIVVKAENESTKIYTINCTKSEKENIPSTTLTKLVYNDKEIDLSLGNNIFLIGLEPGNSKLYLKYETSSSTTNFNIKGLNNLNIGLNTVEINVTDIGCKNKKYILRVYIPNNKLTYIKSINDDINLKNDSIYSINKYRSYSVPSKLVEKLKKSNKSIVYDIVNENNGLIYSFTLDKNMRNIGELKFIKISSEPLTYISNIPKNIKILVYADGIKDKTPLNLYSYNNKKNTYKLIKKNLIVDDGYVNFISDGSEQYVLSETKINSNLIKLIKIISLIILGAILEELIRFIIKKINKNKSRVIKADEIKLDSQIDLKNKQNNSCMETRDIDDFFSC